MVFSNIQTVSWLSPKCCTKKFILGIQNVKKLEIHGDENDDGIFWKNLVHLHQLESLNLFKFYLGIPSARAFPATLKKLKLKHTFISWSDLDIIGAELPNLEVLKLMQGACSGEVWDPNDRVFPRLKLLLIEDHHYLKYWKATNYNFPVLERLFIKHCLNLKEIPIEFADIDSLQLIELEYCTPKLAESAERIQQEQEDLGNNPVVVIIKSPWENDSDSDEH